MSRGKVYFVSAPGRIKIGWTTQPEQRLKQLQTADMELLTTLAIVDGPRRLERHLHKLAQAYCLRREWFSDCPEVREIMAKTLAGEIRVELQKEEEIDLSDRIEYFEFKRLPILDARAEATRLHREFLEEIYEAILSRKAAGKPFDDLIAVMRKLEPTEIDAVTEGFGEQIGRQD